MFLVERCICILVVVKYILQGNIKKVICISIRNLYFYEKLYFTVFLIENMEENPKNVFVVLIKTIGGQPENCICVSMKICTTVFL